MSVAPVALEVANAVHKPRARAPEVAHHVERQPERQKREEKEGAVQDEHQSICEHIQVELPQSDERARAREGGCERVSAGTC